MIEIKQSRKLHSSGYRFLTVSKDGEVLNSGADVLHIQIDDCMTAINLDIDKHGVIRVFSNKYDLMPHPLNGVSDCNIIAKPLKTEKEKKKVKKIVRRIKFMGIDFWSRPIFKVTNAEQVYYLSDINTLFKEGTSEAEVKDFYKDKELKDYITYHGKDVEDDPHGGKLRDEIELEII